MYGPVNVGGGGGGIPQESLEAIRSTATAANASATEAKVKAEEALAAANSAKTTANTAKSTADTALATANALKELFEQSSGGGEVTLSFFHAGTEPSENTSLLWIDTTGDGTGGLKYYTGETWVAVPVAWG